MKPLSIRVWLGLLLVALVVAPAISIPLLLLTRPGPSEGYLQGSIVVAPGLQTEIANNRARWTDPVWQQSLDRQLTQAGLTVQLIDPGGRTVYRSGAAEEQAAGEANNANPETVPALAAVLQVPTSAGDAVAVFEETRPNIRRPGWPLPPAEFLIVPLVQLATLVLIALAIAWFVNRAFIRPLAKLIQAMRQVGSGDLDARLPASRVSEMNDVAAAFAAMAEALRGSLEREDELEQDRRMTISAVVHDLRTPLFSLRGYLAGLASGLANSPEKAARYLQISRDKADALDRLVTDLFTYTRTEYLEEALHPEPLDLRDLLVRTAEGLAPQADAKGVRLLAVGGSPPLWISGDAHLLTRAVENVLDNAIRHTPAGGEIRVDWAQRGGQAIFTVADTGPGIDPADLPHLFSPLFRGESSRNRQTGGAGLGLSIARRFLRAHHGGLTAANAPGGGAIFTASLPELTRTGHAETAPANDAVMTGSGSSGHPVDW